MRHGIIAAAAMGLLAATEPRSTYVLRAEPREREPDPVPRARVRTPAGSYVVRYRSKGRQAKPAKRPNRNTIGKRVRCKHRRAA